MSTIKNISLSADGDALTYEMEDGTTTVIESGGIGVKYGGDGLTFMLMGMAAALLNAHQRIAALEEARK